MNFTLVSPTKEHFMQVLALRSLSHGLISSPNEPVHKIINGWVRCAKSRVVENHMRLEAIPRRLEANRS